MTTRIILSHGFGSSATGTKVTALAALAEALGFQPERPDYSDLDGHSYAASVAPRLQRLQACMQATAEAPILVGSSMGAFVSGLAAARLPCAGLFLLATPVAIPGYGERLTLPAGVPCQLVHGLQDEICGLAPIVDFACRHRLPLLLLPDGHRLAASVDVVCAQFRLFLQALRTP